MHRQLVHAHLKAFTRIRHNEAGLVKEPLSKARLLVVGSPNISRSTEVLPGLDKVPSETHRALKQCAFDQRQHIKPPSYHAASCGAGLSFPITFASCNRSHA